MIEEYESFSNITTTTLVGYSSNSFPMKRGNCFWVETDKGNSYNILNFNYENLKYLIYEKKIVSYPIKILKISDKHAVICDSQIPLDYYSDDFCTVCCPKQYLPVHQRVKQLIQIQSGTRVEYENGLVMTTISPIVENKIPKNWVTKMEPDLILYDASIVDSDIKI